MKFQVIMILLSILLFSQCQSVPPSLRGGVLATFEIDDEFFSVWTTNKHAIKNLLILKKSPEVHLIPNGEVQLGTGQGNHNSPYTWHIDPEDFELAEFTIKVCDVMPSTIEENKTHFVYVIRRFCPWNAKLISLNDYR